MCGIAGIFRQDKGRVEERVTAMTGALRHRGPDDEGSYMEPGLGLGMRRLSIIDLPGGRQPLFNEDRTLVLVFNGEVYNYKELRADLLGRGHRFATQSDGEVILHLYEQKGLDALQDLNGMYAFCLWDTRKKEGLLVRDRLGVKPLYYALSPDGGELCFASEAKALLRAGLSAAPDETALLQYLAFMYVPGPASPFRQIRKLLPGSFLRFGPRGVDGPRPYWSLPSDAEPWEEERLKNAFFELLEHSVELQSRSDVPVGVFLSGGVDSSLLTALFCRRSRQKVLSFNVRYEGADVDEGPYAEQAARAFGTDHRSLSVGLEDVRRDLPRLVWHMDEPHADPALAAAHAVSALAVKDVKVILNGTGGDELFGGYERYHGNPWILRLWHGLPGVAQELLSLSLKASGAGALAEKAGFNRTPDQTYLWRLLQLKPYHWRGFGTEKDYDPLSDLLIRDIFGAAPPDAPNRYTHVDARLYLVDDLLLLLDKATMAASIEGRVPLLDHRLVEWSFHMPGRWKVRSGRGKALVKDWLKSLLPRDILERPKMGFGAPVRRWMERGLFRDACRLISNRPETRSRFFWGLRGGALEGRLKTLNFQQSYVLLVLEIWFRLFQDGQTPDEVSRSLQRP